MVTRTITRSRETADASTSLYVPGITRKCIVQICTIKLVSMYVCKG